MRVALLLTIIMVSLARDESFFAQLRNSEFGQTILQTIQVSLGGADENAAADKIIALLTTMKDDLNNEQRVDDDEIAGKLSSCQAQSQSADTVIGAANEKKAEDEQRLPLLIQEQNDKKAQYDAKQGEEQRNLDRITLLTTERAQTRKDYETRRDELVGLIAALQEAKQILQSNIKSTNFVELKAHHANFRKYYPNQRGFHQMVDLLLEMLSNQEAGSLQKVIAIIDNLVDSIFGVQKEELKQDDAREQDFQNQKERFLLANRRLAYSLADLLSKSEQINQRVLELQNDIATQNAIVSNKSEEKSDWDQTCKDTQAVYNSESDNRKEQLDIIVQCIDIFQTRFNQQLQAYIQRIRV